MFKRTFFSNPAGLGELRTLDSHGNIGADILKESVQQEWRDGEIVNETRETKRTGKVALALPPAS